MQNLPKDNPICKKLRTQCLNPWFYMFSPLNRIRFGNVSPDGVCWFLCLVMELWNRWWFIFAILLDFSEISRKIKKKITIFIFFLKKIKMTTFTFEFNLLSFFLHPKYVNPSLALRNEFSNPWAFMLKTMPFGRVEELII